MIREFYRVWKEEDEKMNETKRNERTSMNFFYEKNKEKKSWNKLYHKNFLTVRQVSVRLYYMKYVETSLFFTSDL